MSARVELTVTRTIRAQPPKVFELWTSPQHVVRWWGGGGITCPEAHIDLREGGTYRIANATPDGAVMWISGVFEVVEPPDRLRYSWVVEPTDDTSTVDVTFAGIEAGTEVTIRHTRISGPDARELFQHGWHGCLDGLEQLASGGRQ